ncbi:MAG TPA: hypothetical protein VG448_07885 [Solirubrobacterales bacterium]|nr:hypothetical protein [Solirubrobacterales bacterium]
MIGLLGITGCGSSSSSTLSKSEYEQKLELVCNKGLREREEFIQGVTQEYQEQGKKLTAKGQAENLRNLMAVYQGTTEEIAEIGVPENEEKKAEELVKEREQAVAKIKADPLTGLSEFSELFAKSYKIAEGFDTKSCAR